MLICICAECFLRGGWAACLFLFLIKKIVVEFVIEIGGLAFAVVIGATVVQPKSILSPWTSSFDGAHFAHLVAALQEVTLR